MAKAPFSLEAIKRIKTKRCLRRKGYVTNERNSIRPTLDVNGIWGGTGEGAKQSLQVKHLLKSHALST
jgi:hypothetical protein